MKLTILKLLVTFTTLVFLHSANESNAEALATPTHLLKHRNKKHRFHNHSSDGSNESNSSNESDEDDDHEIPHVLPLPPPKLPPVLPHLPTYPLPLVLPHPPMEPIPVVPSPPLAYPYPYPYSYPGLPNSLTGQLPGTIQSASDKTEIDGDGNTVNKLFDVTANINIPIDIM